MVPCPSCQNLCGVKSAIVIGERLSYRCSRCSLGFDVAEALRDSSRIDPEASTPVLALKPPRVSKIGPKIVAKRGAKSGLKVEKVVFDDASTAEVTMDLSGSAIEREDQVLYVLDDEQGYELELDDAYVDDVLEAAFVELEPDAEEPPQPSALPIFAKPIAVLEIPSDGTPKTDRSNASLVPLIAPPSPRVTLFPPMVKQFALPLSEVLEPTSKWEPKPATPKTPVSPMRNSASRPPPGRKRTQPAARKAKPAILRHAAALGAVFGIAALTAVVARSVALDDDGVRVSSAMVTHADVPSRASLAMKPSSIAASQPVTAPAWPTTTATPIVISADDDIEILTPEPAEPPAPVQPVAKAPTRSNVASALPAQSWRPKPKVTEVETLTAEADLAYRSGDFARAGTLYRDALALSPRFIPARLGAAAVEWDTGRREQARSRYRALVADAPALAPAIARERAR